MPPSRDDDDDTHTTDNDEPETPGRRRRPRSTAPTSSAREKQRWLCPEPAEGAVEYKLKLVNKSDARFQHLVTQLKYRLSEGDGNCIYRIGVTDAGYCAGISGDEMEQSISTLKAMAEVLNATAMVTRRHVVPAPNTKPNGEDEASVKRPATSLEDAENFCWVDVKVTLKTSLESLRADVRVAVCGSVDGGKSTLVAVLTHGARGKPTLDNGRGSARTNVFRHKHEVATGRTSSISQRIIAYRRGGRMDTEIGTRVLNYASSTSALTPQEMLEDSSLGDGKRRCDCVAGSVNESGAAHEENGDRSDDDVKVLTLIDLGGHEKYLKTALFGLTCLAPDCMLLVVSAAEGCVPRIAREHLAAAIALGVPVVAVLTKADVGANVDAHADAAARRSSAFGATMAELKALLRAAAIASGLSSPSGGTDTEHSDNGSCTGDDAVNVVSDDDDVGVVVIKDVENARAAADRIRGSVSASSSAASAATKLPIFVVSSVSGEGIDVLHAFLDAAHTAVTASNSAMRAAADASGIGEMDAASQFRIEESFVVEEDEDVDIENQSGCATGGGVVVTLGSVSSGSIEVGQKMMLGPTNDDNGFVRVKVTGIQRTHVQLQRAFKGQILGLAIELSSEADGGGGDSINTNGHRDDILRASACAEDDSNDIEVDDDDEIVGRMELGLSSDSNVNVRSAGNSNRVHTQRGAKDTRESDEKRLLSMIRKGSVLLDVRLKPYVSWEFVAVMILFGKRWPVMPRGTWPTTEDRRDGADGTRGGRQSLGGTGETTNGQGFSFIIHCGGVRQVALVSEIVLESASVSRRGLQQHRSAGLTPSSSFSSLSKSRPMSACSGAAATGIFGSWPQFSDSKALRYMSAHKIISDDVVATPSAPPHDQQHNQQQQYHHGGASGMENHDPPAPHTPRSMSGKDDVGATTRGGRVAHVKFRFQHRPEWLQQGSTLLVRDHISSTTAGAGVIRDTLPSN